MIDNSYKPVVSDLDPLIITAPTIRSGTTLLQRLMCSSRRALIYGELCAQDLEMFLNFYVFKSQQYDCRRAEVSNSLRQVLAGEVNDWIPTLMPEVSEYLKAIGIAAFAGIGYCRDYATQAGRPVWGFKHPAWNPATIRLLRGVMPRSRFVFIYRDLKDCLRSAKTHAVTYGNSFSKQEVEQFCRSWAENRSYMQSLDGEATVLSIDYGDLIRKSQATLEKLAEFTGLDDMNPDVLMHRVNAWKGQDNIMQAKNGYFEPSDLDDFDWQIIKATSAFVSEQPRAL